MKQTILLLMLTLVIACGGPPPDLETMPELPALPALPGNENEGKEMLALSFDDGYIVDNCMTVSTVKGLSVCDCVIKSRRDTSVQMIMRGFCEMMTPGRGIRMCLERPTMDQVNSLNIQRDTMTYENSKSGSGSKPD